MASNIGACVYTRNNKSGRKHAKCANSLPHAYNVLRSERRGKKKTTCQIWRSISFVRLFKLASSSLKDPLIWL